MRRYLAPASLVALFAISFSAVAYYERQLSERDARWSKLIDGDYVRIVDNGPEDSILGLLVTMRRGDAIGWYVVSSKVGNSKQELAETVLRDYRRSKVAEFRSVRKNAKEANKQGHDHKHDHKHQTIIQ